MGVKPTTPPNNWRVKKTAGKPSSQTAGKPPLFTKPFKKLVNLFFHIQNLVLSILFFSSNKQVATDDAEGSVILHPSYLVWLESLFWGTFVQNVHNF